MSYERQEWQDLQKKSQISRLRDKRPDLELLQQAEVSAKHLTGIPEWDTYLRFLQGGINKAVAQRDQWLTKMAQPDASDEEVARARRYALMLDAQVNAWRAAASLPADIMRQGEDAEDLLSRVRALDGA